MKLLTTILAFFAFSTAAAAQTCTDARAEALINEYFAFLQANPQISDADIDRAKIELENHYGGEHTDAQACEALRMMMDLLKSKI